MIPLKEVRTPFRGPDVSWRSLLTSYNTPDCPPVSAFGRQVRCDFTEGPCGFVRDRGNVTYGSTNGAELMIEDGDDLPLLVTPRYLFFGKVEFEVRAAAGKGIITTALIQSRSQDEVGPASCIIWDRNPLRSSL